MAARRYYYSVTITDFLQKEDYGCDRRVGACVFA